MDVKMIRRCGLPVAVLLVGFMFAGCGDSQDKAADQAEAIAETETVKEVEATVEAADAVTSVEAALIAKVAAIDTALEKAPADAVTILEKYGMTAEEYEAAVYKIASSPALSEAFKRAKNP